jgi:hypothetical protein
MTSTFRFILAMILLGQPRRDGKRPVDGSQIR